MTWSPDSAQCKAVLLLSGEARYKYFVKKVVDEELIWSLWSDGGWVLAADGNEHQSVPVWPHAIYAEYCANGLWLGSIPKPIPLLDWLSRWTAGMQQDHRLVAVFPTPAGRGVLREPTLLAEDLWKESQNYE